MALYRPGQAQTEQATQSAKIDVNEIPLDKMKWRLNPERPKVTRYKTNIPSLDEFLGGGIPVGLTTIWGNAGCGKSLLAKQIAMNCEGNALYLCGETLNDSPERNEYPHVKTVDYTRFLPNYQQAINELFSWIKHLNPKLVVIDSMTTFLGVSKAALPESSIRDAVWRIHKNAEGLCPIIGISEARGSGYYQCTAGGKGVQHGCSMLVYLYKHLLSRDYQIEGFPNHKIGDTVYTIECQKDKHGLAQNRPMEIQYDKNDKERYKIVNPRA